jgi:hypothetical protein
MKTKYLQELIEDGLQDPKPLVRSNSPDQIQVWWHDLYGTVVETPECFLMSLRLKKPSHPGECYEDFDKVGEAPKEFGASAEVAIGSLLNDLRKRAKELDDPKFGASMEIDNVGTLKWDSQFEWWTGRTFVPWWGDTFAVTLCPGPDGGADKQIAILQDVVAQDGDVRTRFVNAVFRWYIEKEIHGSFECFTVDGPCLDANGKNLAETLAPQLSQPDDIWPLIKPPFQLIIEDAPEGVSKFRINVECTWDEEHGLGVDFENWKIVYVGQQL